MVSVNSVRTAGVLAVLLVSGCATLMPQGTGETGQTTQTRPAEPAVVAAVVPVTDTSATLPVQEYSADGKKVAYVAAPNPYLAAPSEVPPAAVAAFRTASQLMADEKYRDARKAFWAMTNDYPTLSGPWVKLGEIAALREDPERAEKAFRKALEINPENVNAYMALALHQRRKGDFAGARETYLTALGLWKDFPGAHLNLAILYDLYLNQPEQAQPHYEAYDFLTGGNDPKVGNWLIEVRRRTGIETSFIDNPPPAPEPELAPEQPAAEQPAAEEPVAAEAGTNSGPAEQG